MTPQPSILAPPPAHAAFLFLDRGAGTSPAEAVEALASRPHARHLLVGLGSTLLGALGADMLGMRPMPALVGHGVAIPRTPSDLMVRIAGGDAGMVMHRERALLTAMPGLVLTDRVDGFVHRDGRDLTGYEDGTENPTGEHAAWTALANGAGPGLDGSSVLAIQRWVHDLDAFDRLSSAARDAVIGRERHSNEELPAAPESAHVKRTAQEDFAPEAFLVRRSMPWRDHRGAGLIFASFSASLDPFEAQLRRMVGLDDGVVDAIFGISRPATGATYWCPPLRDGRLDLRGLPAMR